MTRLVRLGLFSDPAQKLVELAHLTKVRWMGLQEQWLGTENI